MLQDLATVMFVALNMVLLVIHTKMIAAPLLLKVRTAVLSLSNLSEDDAEPEAAASDLGGHFDGRTTPPPQVIFTLREPHEIVDFGPTR